jgi:hypothetical protein
MLAIPPCPAALRPARRLARTHFSFRSLMGTFAETATGGLPEKSGRRAGLIRRRLEALGARTFLSRDAFA